VRPFLINIQHRKGLTDGSSGRVPAQMHEAQYQIGERQREREREREREGKQEKNGQ
jgi:hypothetical protein